MQKTKYILYTLMSLSIPIIVIKNPAFATTMDTNVNIRPSMTLSVSTNDITLNLNPATKPFDTKDLTITIGTNNPTGYKLYLTSDSTNLINTEDSSKTIETLPSSTPATGYDQASFPANYWGYRKSNGSSSSGNYLPFNSNLLVSSSTGPSNEITTSIGLASKIDYLKESGTYTLDFKLNAVPTITQYYMQDLSDPTLASSVCVAEHPTIVFDSRDEQAYMVQRLKDGNCWLLENLRLDISNANVQANLTSATTNATDETLNYLKNGGGSSPYPANGVIAKTASSGSWGNDYTNPYIATQYENTTQPASGSSPAGKIGIYYNYCAASAGSYCYATNASSGDATQDICPAGWRLPTGGASGEYQALYTAYSSNVANFQASLSTPLSGLFRSGTADDQGAYGRFWSSTRYNGDDVYDLRVNSSTVSPQNSNGRSSGYPVRCVLK